MEERGRASGHES